MMSFDLSIPHADTSQSRLQESFHSNILEEIELEDLHDQNIGWMRTIVEQDIVGRALEETETRERANLYQYFRVLSVLGTMIILPIVVKD